MPGRATIYAGSLVLDGLDESDLWARSIRNGLLQLPEACFDIVQYAFTELVNNAIDHSEGSAVMIGVGYDDSGVYVTIADDGIGIFRKIQRHCELEDIRESVFELTKGKLTTDPTSHTGEGIFFTARAATSFLIQSYELFLHCTQGDDWTIGNMTLKESRPERDIEDLKGTLVEFRVSNTPRVTLTDLFASYSDSVNDQGFWKTMVPVNIAEFDATELVSRSKAKRVVAGLNKFREVVLDFTGVEKIGPSFADEIFRVFASRYPDITLRYVNANQSVEQMIKRAISNRQ